MLIKSIFSSVIVGILLTYSTYSIVASAEKSNVISLTKDKYDKTIFEPKTTLVEFFAPWCPHCKALAPDFEKAATALKAENINLAKIDCTKEIKACSDITGYPTLKIVKNGRISEYTGGLKAKDIVSHMKFLKDAESK